MNISEKEHERRMVFARQEAALPWTTPNNSHKEMDVDLAESFAEILVKHMYEPHLGCATTGKLLDEVKARVNLHYTTLSG